MTVLSLTEKLDTIMDQLNMLRLGFIFMIAMAVVMFLSWAILDSRRSRL